MLKVYLVDKRKSMCATHTLIVQFTLTGRSDRDGGEKVELKVGWSMIKQVLI